MIAAVNLKRGTVRFLGYETIDDAKRLTNIKLYADVVQTKTNCNLVEGEYFWFDIIGCLLKENNEVLGTITDIQRMADVDYMVIDTDNALIEKGMPKQFLLPYIDRYVIRVDIEAKCVYTQDAKDVLEAS